MYALFVHQALDLGNPSCKGPSAQNHKRVALDLADCKADITITWIHEPDKLPCNRLVSIKRLTYKHCCYRLTGTPAANDPDLTVLKQLAYLVKPLGWMPWVAVSVYCKNHTAFLLLEPL